MVGSRTSAPWRQADALPNVEQQQVGFCWKVPFECQAVQAGSLGAFGFFN